jgi:hypothetical protein
MLFRCKLVLILLCYVICLYGQNPAIVEFESGGKGMLLPRTNSDAVQNPTYGLVIYDTTSHGIKIYDGAQWLTLLTDQSQQFYYLDKDGDSYGDSSYVVYAREQPGGYLANKDDCNDEDAGINPEAVEICDGQDNDCDGEIDELTSDTVECRPCDGSDTDLCEEGLQVKMCVNGEYVWGPCSDDTGDNVEECDGEDNNCDGVIDEGCACTNGQTMPANCDGPDADLCPEEMIMCTCVDGQWDCPDCPDDDEDTPEICDDGIDNDCDGLIDTDDPDCC